MYKLLRWFVYGVLLGVAIVAFVASKLPETKVLPNPSFHQFNFSQSVLETAKDFTVLISDEGFGGIGRGTGVLLDATHVLTCYHMVPDDNIHEMWVYTRPIKTIYKARPIFGSRFKDLAILELEEPVVINKYAVFQSSYTIGDPILAIGNTLGCMQWFVSYGVISGAKTIYLLTDTLIKGGNSGGPWINSKGEVVALTDWSLTQAGHDNPLKQDVGGGVSAETIQKFLQDWKEPNLFQMLLGG